MSGIAENPILPLDHLALRGADDAPALVLRGETLDYKALRSRVSRLAAWLAQEIPEKGARVATWAAKGELTCLMPLAAARAGLIHVPINPLLKHAQVAYILADSGAVMLIGTPARLATLDEGDVPDSCQRFEEGAALAAAQALGGDLPPSAADPDDLVAILRTVDDVNKGQGGCQFVCQVELYEVGGVHCGGYGLLCQYGGV